MMFPGIPDQDQKRRILERVELELQEVRVRYEGITWGPSMRGYLSDNKARIGRVESSLALLKNQDGQFANDHRMLLSVFRDIDAVLAKHIELADSAIPPADRET